jgi:hypothetical protein
MSTFASSLNISQPRCAGVPTPPEPQVSAPGLRRASDSSSFTVFAGTLGWPTSMVGALATGVIATRSRTGS